MPAFKYYSFAAFACLAAGFLITACTAPSSRTQSTAPGEPPASLPFYLGADISSLAGGTGRGGAGTSYLDTNNTPGTEIAIMSNHAWNAFRLRVFLSPIRAAPNNSLENTITLAKQIKSATATGTGGDGKAIFMLDIHYSDTWADPQHQETPVAWRNLSVDQIEQKVADYTTDVLTQLKNANAAPDYVQIGNEITGGMLWPTGHVRVPPSTVKNDAGRIQPLPEPYDDAAQWANLLRYIKAGTRATRATLPSAKIIIHIDCGGDWPVTPWFFDHLADAKVDFDIIGQSFYPQYHGTLAQLQQNSAETFNRYRKPIMIVETGYPQTGPLPTGTAGRYMLWPATPQGQLQFMADLINTARRDPHNMGVFYWQPEGRGRGNALWTTSGTPAPALLVNEHLKELATRPASQMPESPATATQPLP